MTLIDINNEFTLQLVPTNLMRIVLFEIIGRTNRTYWINIVQFYEQLLRYNHSAPFWDLLKRGKICICF